jgi:hypothetical protein
MQRMTSEHAVNPEHDRMVVNTSLRGSISKMESIESEESPFTASSNLAGTDLVQILLASISRGTAIVAEQW